MAKPTIRILQDQPLDGPTNMARDEALLTRVGNGISEPTLRLYEWSEPTISLGYFQCYAEYEALPSPHGDCGVVRRLTGGGAILHDLELTYSLTLPLNHSLLSRGPKNLYALMHETVIACIRPLKIEAEFSGASDDSGPTRGPFFCFARRHELDVLVAGDKLAGSAQRRTQQAVLQHGSIILGNRYEAQPTAKPAGSFEAMAASLRVALPAAFAARSVHTVVARLWSEGELAAAGSLRNKYAGDEWTRKR